MEGEKVTRPEIPRLRRKTGAPGGKLNLEDSPPRGSRTTDSFEKLELIGAGTYGQVYKAKDITTGEIVALKKFPITALREIRILKALRHENIIKLKEVVRTMGKVAQVGEAEKCATVKLRNYMEHDLLGLQKRPEVRFSVPQIKCYMKQLLTGLSYCHINRIVHRDIKGCNLLINNEGILKLADFRLARPFGDIEMTDRVISLWYRPPEILLGATKYGPAVDIWSAGCLFAELIAGKPILPGKTEQEQLNKIFVLCGSPDENNWPGISKLPLYVHFKQTLQRRLRQEFIYFERHALDLLDRMLTLDPSRVSVSISRNLLYQLTPKGKRISAMDALDTDYFWTEPLPCDSKSLPKYESSRALDYDKRRQRNAAEKRQQQQQKPPRPPVPYHPMANQQQSRQPFPSIPPSVKFQKLLHDSGASRSSQTHVSHVPSFGQPPPYQNPPRPESRVPPGSEYGLRPGGYNQQSGSDQMDDSSNQ